MGTPVSIRVEGLSAVVRGLLAAGLEVDDLKDAFSAIARFGAVVAAKYTPVGSGKDKHPGQLRADVRGNRARSKAVITAGRASIPYAGPINYGWKAHNISPAGFMQRADKDLRPWALRRLEANITTVLRKKGLT